MGLTIIPSGGGLEIIDESSPLFYAAASYGGLDITATDSTNVLLNGDWSFGGVDQDWVRNATAEDSGVSVGETILTQPGLYRANLGVAFSSPPTDRLLSATISVAGFSRELIASHAGGSNAGYYMFNLDQWQLTTRLRHFTVKLRWSGLAATTTVTATGVELELFKLAAV